MQKATYYTKHCATSDLIHISFSQVLHRMMYTSYYFQKLKLQKLNYYSIFNTFHVPIWRSSYSSQLELRHQYFQPFQDALLGIAGIMQVTCMPNIYKVDSA